VNYYFQFKYYKHGDGTTDLI